MLMPFGKYEMNSMPGTKVTLDGKQYLYFAGTSYFQLHSHPEVIKASKKAINRYGTGSATTRTLTGTTSLLKKVEKKIAEYFNAEDAVYLPSGYLSSLAGLKALDSLYNYDVIFIDEGSHYSLLENSLATGKKVIRFKHLDVSDLKEKIKGNLDESAIPLIASDGLFPINATLAPIDSYLKIAEESNGLILIDDSHGVGILGQHGRGTCESLGIKSERIFIGATLSKAFGAYGGILFGSELFVKEVRKGSVMTGSSSPMSAAVAAGIKGLKLVKSQPKLREKLWNNSKFLKEKLSSIGISVVQNEIPIVSFAFGSSERMQTIQKKLMDRGVYIQYTNYQGAGLEGVLRIVVSSNHSHKQINKLIDALQMALYN